MLLFVVCFCTWFVWESVKQDLPKPGQPPHLYSNQCYQDIRSLFLDAIDSAQKAVHLVMFGLSDKPVLSAIARKNLSPTIYYDAKNSPNISRWIQKGHVTPIKHSNLMHQKILIIDHEMVFLGSANMTTASLRMHDNLVIGFVNQTVARFLEEHPPFSSGYLKTKVGGQDIELWLLPDPRGHAITELRKSIRSATRSIQSALFTLTHPNLVDELIEAHQRGVKVTLIIDLHAGMGASCKAIEQLKKAGVDVRLSQGTQLLHHKFIFIDEKDLITGSANWTKAAFYKNSDCVIAIHNLDITQKKFMKQLWQKIETSTKIRS